MILHRRYSRVTVQKVTSELRFKLMVRVNLNLSLRSVGPLKGRIDLGQALYSGVFGVCATAGYLDVYTLVEYIDHAVLTPFLECYSGVFVVIQRVLQI
jgi:hypothetical protein